MMLVVGCGMFGGKFFLKEYTERKRVRLLTTHIFHAILGQRATKLRSSGTPESAYRISAKEGFQHLTNQGKVPNAFN